jgi:hypothetical protein
VKNTSAKTLKKNISGTRGGGVWLLSSEISQTNNTEEIVLRFSFQFLILFPGAVCSMAFVSKPVVFCRICISPGRLTDDSSGEWLCG